MRKISKTLAIMSLFAPLGANALGIGDIRLHSALNELLNAEIPLVTSNADEMSDIRVALASQGAFVHAHIERSYLLSKLLFSIFKKPDGSYAIKVTSKDVINEPFLNFMIEVYWPQGRLQREFTVLLDPPVGYRETAATGDGVPAAEDEGGFREQPMGRAAPQGEGQARARRNIARRGTSPAVEIAASPALASVTGKQYGPIEKNETLWGIANRFSKDENVSQQQMLVAIYRANPKAFYKPSLGALKWGEKITIPDQASIQQMERGSAARQASRNTAAQTNAQAIGEPGQPAAGTTEQAGQGRLKILAPAESTAKAGEESAAGKKGKTGKSKEDLALELADTARQENESIRKRLDELEQQLVTINKLLVLKDEQIASLQAQQTAAGKTGRPTTPAPTVRPPEPPIQTSPPAPAAEASAKAPSVVEVPPKGLPPGVPPQQPAQPAASPEPPGQAAPPTLKPVERIQTKPKPPTETASAEGQRQNASKVSESGKEAGFFAGLSGQPYYYIAGAALGLLLLTGVWQINRRRKAMIDETESILTLDDKDQTAQQKRVSEPVSSQSTVSELSSAMRSSFLSEFTPSDFDALGGEMDAVDPIPEADVYLAYGRYKQAEELILNAIGQNPERDDFKLKLLEIHYATENAQAFESYAQELASTHKEAKPEFWGSVAEMGHELCPGNPLFEGQPTVTPDSTKADPQIVSKPPVAPADDVYLFNPEEEVSYDFSIQPRAVEPRAVEPKAVAPKAVEPRAVEPKAVEPKAVDSPLADHAGDSQSTIVYDFFAKPEGGVPAPPPKVEPETVHLDNYIPYVTDAEDEFAVEHIEIPDESMEEMLAKLDALSGSKQAASSLKAVDIKEASEISFDDSRKDSVDELESHQYYDDSSGYMQVMTDIDEQETKLDLAKAYFDMGDVESARTILEAVAEKGNEAQKEEANALLGKLSGQAN